MNRERRYDSDDREPRQGRRNDDYDDAYQGAEKKHSNLGIASLVLGLLSLTIAWIPCFGMITWPVTILGGILGFVRWTSAASQKSASQIFPIVGTAVNAVAFLMPFFVLIALGLGSGATVPPVPKQANQGKPQQQPPPQQQVNQVQQPKKQQAQKAEPFNNIRTKLVEIRKTFPPKEEEFVNVLDSFITSYQTGNDLKRSTLRESRRGAIAKMFEKNNEVKDWLGILTDMGVRGGGNARIEIKLAQKITLESGSDGTAIAKGTPLFDAISEMKNGDMVVFSGEFLSSEEDFIKEGSITRHGSMTDPAYIFRLTAIRQLKE